jgi:hypothetical protein
LRPNTGQGDIQFNAHTPELLARQLANEVRRLAQFDAANKAEAAAELARIDATQQTESSGAS